MPLLERLEGCKGYFSGEADRETLSLLERLEKTHFYNPADLIRFHEAVLFLRAYPQSAKVAALAHRILFSFGERLLDLPPKEFEYADVSGIAGSGMTTNFSYPFVKSLAARHAGNISLDWKNYRHTGRLGQILGRIIPEAFEDWAIAPHPNWRRWYEKAGCTVGSLIDGVAPEVYDLLELPIRWELRDSNASRSCARLPRKKLFYHDARLLSRKEVSVEAEFTTPAIAVRRVIGSEREQALNLTVDASAVRYRELYGFLYPDIANVFHADLGRGVDFYFFGAARKWKLPRRHYCCGMYFKNGVPAGYVEAMWPRTPPGRCMEVGFNLYYTFRQGETAWLYARLLKLFHERFNVTSFLVDPYQLGHENSEAIESGSFWFYYKLGFRPQTPGITSLAEREFTKISAHPNHRSSAAFLRKLAMSPMIYSCG